jgi:adenylate cyclase
MYSIVTIGTYIYQASDAYHGEVERKKKLIDFYENLGIYFLLNQKPESLVSKLLQARELREFDFFLLRKNGDVLGFYNKDNYLEGINHDYKIIDEFQETEEFALKTVAVNDYKLTVGINKVESSFLLHQFQARKRVIIQDLILVTTLVFIIVYLILKDIIQISKALQSRTREDLDLIQTRSKEGEILLQAATGYEKSTQGLRKDNLLLASSLAPAVRSEIRSGQEPPYEIDCTLGRIDLNGYTQLMLQKEPRELLSILNQYFQNSRDLIERYNGGLIYQYVGDEIIFLFKEDPKSPSVLRAVSAVRSMMEMAEGLVTPGVPNGMRLKASLVSGKLQFVKLDQGYAFSGLPLIESVRMLGQVSERSESILVVYSDSLKDISEYAEASGNKTAVFKGFATESHIVEIKKFTTVDIALKKFPLSKVSEHFRSNRDLLGVLTALEKFVDAKDENKFFELIGPLRNMQVGQVDEKVVTAYLGLLKHCLKLGDDKLPESKRLASVISLSQNILQKDQLRPQWVDALQRCENAQDPRVQANALIVQAHFDLDIKGLDKKMNSTNNRIAADAILVAGRQDFNEDLFTRVKSFLQSDQPRFKASALYLIAALIEYHFDRDLVYLKANSYLRQLAKEIPPYTKDPNPMVQSRARLSLSAIQKVGLYEN